MVEYITQKKIIFQEKKWFMEKCIFLSACMIFEQKIQNLISSFNLKLNCKSSNKKITHSYDCAIKNWKLRTVAMVTSWTRSLVVNSRLIMCRSSLLHRVMGIGWCVIIRGFPTINNRENHHFRQFWMSIIQIWNILFCYKLLRKKSRMSKT